MVRPITHEALTIAGVEHGFFTREGGISEGIFAGLNCGPGSGDDGHKVRENRTRVAAFFGQRPEKLLTCYQVHSADVAGMEAPEDIWENPGNPSKWSTQERAEPSALPIAAVSRPEQGQRKKADALVTKTPGLVLGILTADCTPVLFADAQARVIGAAHAGWKGAIGGIVENTLLAMETLGAQRSRIVAAIGPTIAQASYEVDVGFQARFVEENAAYGAFFQPNAAEKFQFDLPAFVRYRLTVAGVGLVGDVACDTYADEARFFSFRRTTHRGEADYGRQVSGIMLR